MAEHLALDLEELRRLQRMAKRPRTLSLLSAEIGDLKIKIPETETEEQLLKPEPKGNFSNDIEQEEDVLSRPVEERFLRKKPEAPRITFQQDHEPRSKFWDDVEQEVDFLSRTIPRSEEIDDIEIKPSVVAEILPNCGEHKNVIELLSEGRRSLLYSSPLTEIKTPMENTVLHIAAWNGKDDIVDLVVERAPNLLFSFNKNKDSALHVAARAGHIPIVENLLAAYTNFERPEIAEAWEKYKSSTGLNTGMTGMLGLLGLVIRGNDQGNTMLHEAMISGKSVGAMIFNAFEPYNIETSLWKWESLLELCKEYAFITNKAKKSVLYLAVVAADKEAVELILDNCSWNPLGLSPVVAAILIRFFNNLN